MNWKILHQIEEVFRIHTRNNLMEVAKDNYFDNTGHFSVSKYKKFLRCELDGLSDYGNPSIPMLVGSYVDSYVEGTLEQFKLDHPEIISTRGKTKGQLKSEFKQAEEICEFIDNDKLLTQFLSGEKQKIFTGEINEVPFKIMMDSYSKGIAISDLKIMRSITDRSGDYYDFISAWGYDTQLACYQEIVRQNTGEQLPVFICALTKEYPINSAIINIPQSILDIAYYDVVSNINRYYDIWSGLEVPVGCGKCKTCISSRNSTPIISLDDIQIGGI